MFLFGREKRQIEEQEEAEKMLSIELKLNNRATDKAVAKSKKVSKDLNKLIKENGFTITIHSAAGGE